MTVAGGMSFEEADKELLQRAFPDIQCLRCGSDEFALLPRSLSYGTFLPVVTMACVKCGHLEQHLLKMMNETTLPISFEPRND